MKEKIQNLKNEIINKVNEVTTTRELNDLKVDYLGKKGPISNLSSSMKDLSNEDKKETGILLNELRIEVNAAFDLVKNKLENEALQERLEKETLDTTLPGTEIHVGNTHPVTRIIEEIEDLFISMGYDVVEGPDVETDEYCFEKLNLPKGHPARDMQDSFYITDEVLLRTQTSAVQARTMDADEEKNPIRIICPGRVFRRDEDATHSHQFHQIEGLVIDKDLSLADLKGTLELFSRKLFGEDRIIRLRPSYFPFTEPSFEVDVSCYKCGGKGCSLCKQTGWIEILGAGLVHPNVLRDCGYDPDKYTGFAFGLGVERVAMLKYGINDIRLLFANDLRLLREMNRVEGGEIDEVK